ncbi:MAG: hypothetical protein QM704_00805 [Anaeromyxobacteraceae bacterium]
MTRALLAVALAVAGCGPGTTQPSTPPSDPGPLASGLAGDWAGTGSLTVPGVDATARDGAFSVALDGRTATLTGACLDGSGTVALEGGGVNAAWHGTQRCPDAAVADCATVTVTLTDAYLTLADGKAYQATYGDVGGCGRSRRFVQQLVGTRATPP